MNRMLLLKRFVIFTFCMFVMTVSLFAQASTTITNTNTPLVTDIFPSCMGELIHVTGNLHVMTRSRTLPSGETSTEFHINLHGNGIGETTGTQYEFTQNTNEIFNHHDDPTLEFIMVDTVHVVSHGNDNDFRLRTHIHVTINANGEVTASINDFERICD